MYVMALPKPLPTTTCQAGPKVLSINSLISIYYRLTFCDFFMFGYLILLETDEHVCDEGESLILH